MSPITKIEVRKRVLDGFRASSPASRKGRAGPAINQRFLSARFARLGLQAPAPLQCGAVLCSARVQQRGGESLTLL
jgi:hypothetical protein